MRDLDTPTGAPRSFTCPCGTVQPSFANQSFRHDSRGRELCAKCARHLIKTGEEPQSNAAPTQQEEPMAKPKRERAKKPKQQHLPAEGMAPKTIREIEVAAELYVDERDTRMKASEAESDAKQALIVAMKKHGENSYRLSDGRVVTVSDKSNVKVTEVESDEDAAAALAG